MQPGALNAAIVTDVIITVRNKNKRTTISNDTLTYVLDMDIFECAPSSFPSPAVRSLRCVTNLPYHTDYLHGPAYYAKIRCLSLFNSCLCRCKSCNRYTEG